jgi:plasmid stability protein
MQQLVLTDVDDVVLHDLRERATRHGRTPAEEAKAILAEALGTKRPDVWAPVDAIYQRLATSGRTFTDCADLLREDRDRMTSVLPFGEVLEAADHLSHEEQEELIAILHRRLAHVARQRLAADIQEARQEFAEGRCPPATPDELMREIMK